MSKPLYIQALKGELGDTQCLDDQTVRWIERNGIHLPPLDYADVSVRNFIKNMLNSWNFVRNYSLCDDMYARGEVARSTIHGDLHAYRVSLMAHCLSDEANSKQAALAGLYHDIARINDKDDEGHGLRSSNRVSQIGLISNEGMSDRKINQILTAISLHESPLSKEQFRDQVIVNIKTADSLDRYRLPKLKWWPDSRRMDNPPNDFIFTIAYLLVLKSEGYYLKTQNARLAIDKAIDNIRESAEI